MGNMLTNTCSIFVCNIFSFYQLFLSNFWVFFGCGKFVCFEHTSPQVWGKICLTSEKKDFWQKSLEFWQFFPIVLRVETFVGIPEYWMRSVLAWILRLILRVMRSSRSISSFARFARRIDSANCSERLKLVCV